MDFTSALLAPIDGWTAELSLVELYCYRSYLYDFFYVWYSASPKAIDYIFEKLPKLNLLLNRDILVARIASTTIDMREGSLERKLHPELAEVQKEISNQLSNRPVEPLEKAEAWLYAVANNYGGEADLEAAVYLASRGLANVDAQVIRQRWYRSICDDVLTYHRLSEQANSGNMRPVDSKTLERAENQTITLKQAADVLRTSHELTTFYSFRDEEQVSVQQTIVRCAEWLHIDGFDEWWRYFTTDLSNGPVDGIDVESFFWFFLWCRSDLALEIANRQGLNAWLHALARSGEELDKPWLRWAYHTQKKQESIDVAAMLAFTAKRVNPDKPLSTVEENALSMLMQCQLPNGAWSAFSEEDTANILATCLAIHALAVCEPRNWLSSAQRGAKWLLDEIREKQEWEAIGVPVALNTVLALDAIELAKGTKKVTFKMMATNSQLTEKPKLRLADLPVYDYNGQVWHEPEFPDCESVTFASLPATVQIDVVLMTATEVELAQTIRLMVPLEGQRSIIETVKDQETYYLGRYGAYIAALFKCRMGADGPAGATLGGNASIRIWNPLAVIMIGIAFGATFEKYKPADVLIASEIMQYESQRVGEETKFTGAIPPSGAMLVNRFENSASWKFFRPNGEKVKRYVGRIFSGNKLIDNEEFKQHLLKNNAGIGGEMEGVGVWAAASRSGVEWILVKAVCDWADGIKTDMYQEMAAASAASLCHHVLSKHTALDDLRRPSKAD
jgi:nucleoside phosphorylase